MTASAGTSGIERVALAPGYSISRLMKGGWHLAGGHGSVDREQAIADMAAFVRAGITTFDCADHYTGVEELIGEFRARHPDLGRRIEVQTKFVPDLEVLPRIDRDYIVSIIDRSLRRLRIDRLDLVQFFWWDWSIDGALRTASVLGELVQAGKIARLGVTNFSVKQLAHLAEAGVPFVSNQVQYSLLDRRPERQMAEYCMRHGMQLLTYGHLLGGFFSEQWLDREAPAEPLQNRSLVKYRLIIDEYGGWDAFQALLRVLARIGARHGVGIGEVAVRWVLDRPQVAGCIVGATSTRHLSRNLRIFSFKLDHRDLAEIFEEIGDEPRVPGDCYELENDRSGPHGRIMRYNQNQV